MQFPGKSRRTPIGIDLGTRSIKAAQLSRRAGKWRLEAAACIPLPVPGHPFDANTARYLRDVMMRHGFKGNDIVLAVPSNQLEVDLLELPPRSSGAPVEQIARAEMARSAKLEDDAFELACWDLPAPARTGATTSVMAMAMRHQHAEALIDPFEAEGFNVVAIDGRCWALARAATPWNSDDAITTVLDIGWSATLLTLSIGGLVIYRRMLPQSGLDLVFNSLTQDFQLNEEEAEYVLKSIGTTNGNADGQDSARIRDMLKRYFESSIVEIKAAFQYATHRYSQTPVRQVLLAGGGSGIAGACELLKKELEIETSVLSPSTVVECPPDLASRCGDGVLSTGLGLAMHGVSK